MVLEREQTPGGADGVSGTARRDIEALSGQPVVNQENYKTLRQGRQRELQPPLFGELAPDDTTE